MTKHGGKIACTCILVMTICVVSHSADRGIGWLKGKCPNGAFVWDHGGAKIIELSSGTTKSLGGGGSVEFSTGGSFLGWNSSGKARYLGGGRLQQVNFRTFVGVRVW